MRLTEFIPSGIERVRRPDRRPAASRLGVVENVVSGEHVAGPRIDDDDPTADGLVGCDRFGEPGLGDLLDHQIDREIDVVSVTAGDVVALPDLGRSSPGVLLVGHPSPGLLELPVAGMFDTGTAALASFGAESGVRGFIGTDRAHQR